MKRVIAIASGKGGVGKSTVAVNLAVSLANMAANGVGPKHVALIDVDFYGPSVPMLMGGGKIQLDHEERIIPPKKFGVKYISIGFFLQSPDDPVIWRGPMFGKAINQLFKDVSWGEVDFCIVDLPPGTGDAQLSLSQLINLDGALMVTTPQEVSLIDVRKAMNMFSKVNVPVIGVIENMASFITPSGEKFDIFGAGGGKALAEQFAVPFFGSIPLDISVREGGDKGEPVALKLDSSIGNVYRELALQLWEEVEKKPTAAAGLKVVN